MTTAAKDLLHEVVDVLQDPTSITWTMAELVRILNGVQVQILELRPDALATNAALALVAGTKQALPTTAAKLIKAVKNTASKKPVTLCQDPDILDVCSPGWHAMTGVVDIVHYLYDERDAMTFYVHPPAAGSGSPSLDIVYAAYPTAIAVPADNTIWSDVVGNVSVRDIFVNALREGVLWRACAKQTDVAPNAARALAHQQNFASMLGVEIKATLAVSPRAAA